MMPRLRLSPGLTQCAGAAILALAVAGCVAAGDTTSELGPGLTYCREPRPQMCIQVYDPVCARAQGGAERTFGNACSACSDPGVSGYRPGACE